jgi:hypothetical protein
MEVRQIGTVEMVIRHAAAAGGLRAGARRWPEAARGLLKAAEHHSQRAAALAQQIGGTDLKGSFRSAPIMPPDWS